MSGGHAPLAPSAAGRWAKCALSVSLEAAYPDTEESPESMEGTAAHWVNEMTIKGTPPQVDQLAPNNVAVTREMLEGADLVCEAIEKVLGPQWRSIIVVERRVQVPRVHPTHCYGTPDYYAWARLPDGRLVLFLFDYKFGHGVVEVFENWQLVTYAAGLMQEANADDLNTVICFAVIQPRAHHKDGPVRWWQARGSDIRAQVNILHMQGQKALAPDPEAFPDPDACRDCRGRHACVTLQRAAYLAADKGKKLGAAELSPHAMGLELRELTRAQALLKARVSGLEAQVLGTINQGKNVPFWMKESAAGRLAWTRPVAEIVALGEMLQLPLSKPDVITPTQALAAGFPESLIGNYAKRPVGATKLVPDDGTKARLTFGSSVA